MIGQELEGDIKRIDCAAYEYTVPETGEVVMLEYTYQFVPAGVAVEETVPETAVIV